MSTYRSRVRLSLSQKEADAVIAALSLTGAGELGEIYPTAREVTAFERADRKVRAAVQAARERDKAKARTEDDR